MSIVKLLVANAGVAFIALGTGIPLQAVTINYGGNTTGANTFNRPIDTGSSQPIALSAIGTAVPYQSQPFFVDTSDSYNFLSNSLTSGYDHYLVLYENTFNPNNALINALIASDELGNNASTSGFNNIPLLANTQYFLVTTGYSNNNFGVYSNSITTSTGSTAPGKITLNAAAVPFEISPGLGSLVLGTWGAIAYFKSKRQNRKSER